MTESLSSHGGLRDAPASFVTKPQKGRAAFLGYMAQLDQAQKPGGGVPAYMRWVNRRWARSIAALAAVAGFTPNMVTALSATFTCLGLILLVALPVAWLTGVIVAVLLALGFAFDSADGQLARLTGAGSPAGEWLDHVVDAIRTPAVHLAIAAAVLLKFHGFTWLVPVSATFAVLATGQFISQILAEQLVRNQGKVEQESNGIRKSLVLLPTDTGVLCWGFLLWGSPALFTVYYAMLFACNVVHTGVSMRRKYQTLAAISSTQPAS